MCKNANNEASHFWCIFGATFGGLIIVCIVLACTMFVCQQMGRRRIARPAGRGIATNTGTGISQLNPPYPCQVPPAFQQSYPHYPHRNLSSIRHLRHFLPTTLKQQKQVSHPPSYNEATQGRSGGEYNPHISYGAAPSATPMD